MIRKWSKGEVGFEPFFIRFGNRRYQGNPLTFFEENTEIYSNLTRTELSKFDPGLYKALRRAGQLELAIPERKMYVPKRIKILIQNRAALIDSHSSYNGDLILASKNLPYNSRLIKKLWEDLRITNKKARFFITI